MRIALYARVSTEEQAKHGLSIDTQLDNLRQWALRERHEVVAEYVDAGISARKSPLKRPALQSLLQNLDGLDAVVFTKLDRWTRNIKGYYSVQEQLDAARVAWIATQEDYETVTASGRFKVNIMLSVAENEADRTGERIRVVFDRKVAKGEYLGQALPLGYTVQNKRLVPDQNADIVRQVFDQFLLTGSVYAAMNLLHEYGIMYRWNSVACLLRNEMYIGKYKDNPAYCPAIISPEVFSGVQRQLSRRSVYPAKRTYLFNGLLFCPECGKRMTGTYKQGNIPDHRFVYRCNQHYNSRLCSSSRLIRESTIETFLLSRLESEVASISGTVEQTQGPKPVDNTKKLERLTDLYVDGHISKEEYLSRRELLMAPTPLPTPSHSALRDIVLDNFRENYETLTRTEKRALWRSVVDRIDVEGEDLVITFL